MEAPGRPQLGGERSRLWAVSVLSNTLASMRVRLMRESQEQSGDTLARLVGYQPNPRMDAFTFWQTMEACRSTAGNCYAFKVPGAHGTVEALDILDPNRVEPVRDLDTGDIWYRVTPQDGGTWYIPGREMIHCRHVGTGGDKGVSPMTVLADTLDYDDQMKTFSLEQVKGVNGAVVLTFPSDMGEAPETAGDRQLHGRELPALLRQPDRALRRRDLLGHQQKSGRREGAGC